MKTIKKRQKKQQSKSIRQRAKVKRIYQKEYFIRPQESKWEKEEFGPGKIDIVLCPECGVVYYNKSWHHNLRNKKNIENARRVAFELCPACKMKKNNQYEGEIRISGVPAQKQKEILNVVHAIGERARLRDPLDRILKTKSSGKNLNIYLSENQLTNKMAKKLSEIYKKSFSRPVLHKGKGEDVFIVTMEWIK